MWFCTFFIGTRAKQCGHISVSSPPLVGTSSALATRNLTWTSAADIFVTPLIWHFDFGLGCVPDATDDDSAGDGHDHGMAQEKMFGSDVLLNVQPSASEVGTSNCSDAGGVPGAVMVVLTS